MAFDDKTNYYEVLEISSDASEKEIREAYLRLKGTYGKESAAAYALLETDEKESTLRDIEEAYQVLSSSERRQHYDKGFSQGFHSSFLSVVPGEPVAPEALLDPPPTELTSAVKAEKEMEPHPKLPQPLEITEWGGQAIRAAREKQSVSIEEIAEETKISKRYIGAIESESYEDLPAAVYLRGFVIQIARKLGLPQDLVATSYMKRYRNSHPEE